MKVIKKKKIVYVVESLGGGVLTYLEHLCNNLPSDFNITLLYGVRDQTPADLENHFIKKIRLVKIRNFQRNVNPLSDLKAYREIKKNIEEIRPNIVHLNSSKAGALGRIMKFINFHKYKNIEFYYTPHGYAFLMGNVSKVKKNIYYLIEKVLGNLNTTTIACGKGEYNYSRKISSNSLYVNNAVDYKLLNSFVNKKSNQENTVYTVGRITYQKNPELFNEIALNNPKTKFVWIGDGPERNLINAKNIEITGWLDADSLYKKVQPYNFFILCSRWEGLPISLLEAMAMKKCCFVTNVSGNNEVINDSNGVKFSDYKEFDDLFNALTPKQEDKISNKASDDINDYYSMDAFLSSYENIYNK